MSNSSDYKNKYEHNEAFVKYIQENDTCEFCDWEIVATFYAALHFMNLYLNKRFNVNIDLICNHKKRAEVIKQKCDTNIYSIYDRMYCLSRTARYQYVDVSQQVGYMQIQYEKLKKLCQNSMLATYK